jgi:hypothetical protein
LPASPALVTGPTAAELREDKTASSASSNI